MRRIILGISLLASIGLGVWLLAAADQPTAWGEHEIAHEMVATLRPGSALYPDASGEAWFGRTEAGWNFYVDIAGGEPSVEYSVKYVQQELLLVGTPTPISGASFELCVLRTDSAGAGTCSGSIGELPEPSEVVIFLEKQEGVLLGANRALGDFEFQAAPTPAVTPAGDVTVTPPSGPVGSTVSFQGNFDQAIRTVSFECGIGIVVAHRPPEPARHVAFQFTIPERLFIQQGGGATMPTPIGDCHFLAVSGHDLLARRIPFTVTAGLPGTGSAQHERGVPRAAIGLAALGVALATGGVLLARSRRAA